AVGFCARRFIRLRTGGLYERVTRRLLEAKRPGERADGLHMGPPSLPPLEGADGVHRKAGTGRKLLLREACSDPQHLQVRPKRFRSAGLHEPLILPPGCAPPVRVPCGRRGWAAGCPPPHTRGMETDHTPNPTSSSPLMFEDVVVPHLDAAYRLARSFTDSEDDAEDVVQEAALRAFRYFRTFSGGNGRAWFLRIVRHI